MIIVQTATKDTFVTDLSTQYNKGVDANFGQASTLDLFKIVGENKNVKSRSLMSVLSGINNDNNGDTFTLTDSSENSVVFIIRTLEATVDGSAEVNGNDKKIKVGLLGAIGSISSIRDRIVSSINSVTSNNSNQLTLNITATALDTDSLLLEQNVKGKLGDTTPTTTGNSVTITPFRRFEHSAILLKFDLADFKEKYTNYNPDAPDAAPAGWNDSGYSSGNNFKAILRLKDVGVSSTRPKNFKIRLRVLNEEFNEGLGRDVIHFSDIGDANFKTINSNTNKTWAKEGIVTLNDTEQGSTTSPTWTDFSHINIDSGKEDISFDITSYIQHYLYNNHANYSQCFVIDFDHENMFDGNTYFLKKFASRNNFNKNFHPKIEMKIKDSIFEILPQKDKKRYLDNPDEKFYIKNIVDSKLQDFPIHDLKIKLDYNGVIGYETKVKISNNTQSDGNLSFTITDPSGTTKNIRLSHANTSNYTNDGVTTIEGNTIDFYIGVHNLNTTQIANKIATELTKIVANTDLANLTFTGNNDSTFTIRTDLNSSQIERDLFSVIKDTNSAFSESQISVTGNILDNANNDESISNPITMSGLKDYRGKSINSIKVFEKNNDAGIVNLYEKLSRFNNNINFQSELTSKGYVTIKTTYYFDDGSSLYDIKSEDVKFYLPDNLTSDTSQSLRVVLDTSQKRIVANDVIDRIKFSFIDTKKQYDAVKVPVDLVSENIGSINYSMYDIDTGEEIISKDGEYTKLFFNGQFYHLNLYSSKNYKNKRVSFIFYYTDSSTGLEKQISDKSLIIRFE